MSLEILDYQQTQLGTLMLRRRELLSLPGTMVTEVTLNHEFLMSSYLTESERALVRIGLEQNSEIEPKPAVVEHAKSRAETEVKQQQKKKKKKKKKKSVLIGGLGLGYSAAEALRSADVEFVLVVEFLPQVINWLANDLIPLSTELKTDSRLSIVHDDVYRRLTAPPKQQFDLIAIDVDHSPADVLGEQSHQFYTFAGLQAAAQHLFPGGVLAVWSYAEDTPLLENMRQVFDAVSVEQVTVWNNLINVEQTDWLFFGAKKT